MKRTAFLILCLAALAVTGCKDHYAAGQLITTSFVAEYRCLDIKHVHIATREDTILIKPIFTQQRYNAFDRGDDKEVYDSLTLKNGDTHYNGPVTWECFDTRHDDTTFVYFASTENLVKIELTAMNRAWDADHEAGASINDVAAFKGNILSDWIREGYPASGDPYSHFSIKHLDEMTPADYRLKLSNIGQTAEIFFTQKPAEPGKYTIEVKLYFEDGTLATAVELEF